MADDQDLKAEKPETTAPGTGGPSEAQEKPPEEKAAAPADAAAPTVAPAKAKSGKKKAEGQLTPRQANLLLIGLTAYVVVLAVLAVDQIFELGLIRPELDRLLIARIEKIEPAPEGVPSEKLAQLRQALSQFANPNVDPRLTAVGRQIDDEAAAFAAGSPPDAAALQSVEESIDKLRKAQPPLQDAAALDALASMAQGLKQLTASMPEAQAKALAERREASDYIINYHEFSIPHLIRTLRKSGPSGQAAARYCLDQIARRFFRYAGPEMTTAEQWKDWWKSTEAVLEGRSRR